MRLSTKKENGVMIASWHKPLDIDFQSVLAVQGLDVFE
jgi:hypothetical protein